MANYTTINKPSEHFNTTLYTGNKPTGQSITGNGHKPDFLWFKNRASAGYNYALFDNVRGVTKFIASNNNSAEGTSSDSLTSFDTDGYTLGADANGYINQTPDNHVAWSWKASNATAVSNTDGSITSSVSANTTAGFSIVSYTGNGTAGATVGHGLGVKPDMMIVKIRSTTNNWGVYHKSMGETKAMYLDLNTVETTDGWLNNTAPTSSVFTLSGGNYGNTNGNTHIAYCFNQVPGYSKFGYFKGLRPFVYCGFKPAMVIIKSKDTIAENWNIMDSKRDTYNGSGSHALIPSTNGAEYANNSGWQTDFLSNGFKINGNQSSINYAGTKYIYMAFAEAPIVGTNNIPANAR